MNYAAQQRDPRRHLIGLISVVGFHIVLGYALMNGLARKVVEVLKQPLTVNVVEEIKAPPPPPPKALPPPPKVVAPPPAYVPPPEVTIQAPVQPAITTSQKPVPEQPAVVAAPAAPAPINVSVACPNHKSARIEMPRQATRLNLSGDVLVGFTVTPSGDVKDVRVIRSSNPIFNSAALAAVAQYRCVGQGHDAPVQVPFAFRVEG